MSREFLKLDGQVQFSPRYGHHENQPLARSTVAREVRRGQVMQAKYQLCIVCGERAKDLHHHNGYDAWHQLDVVPVCRKCHCLLEKQEKEKRDKYINDNKQEMENLRSETQSLYGEINDAKTCQQLKELWGRVFLTEDDDLAHWWREKNWFLITGSWDVKYEF